MPNEIQTLNPAAMTAAYPLQELREMATAFVECGFYGFKKPAEALVLMLQARADGVDPMTAAAQYSIIQGRPALKSEAILIRFQMAGGSIAWRERGDEKCVLWLSHPKGGELIVTWDKDRAIKAKLWNKDNFQKHPAQMLAARCISEGVRALFPACLSGCYTPEEVQFFDDKPAAPAPAASPAPAPEAPKATRGRPKKAEAQDAEVVAPEAAAETVQHDEKTRAFVASMCELRESNAAVFSNAWRRDYIAKYGEDFASVPLEDRPAVYRAIRSEINAAAAESVGDYLEG